MTEEIKASILWHTYTSSCSHCYIYFHCLWLPLAWNMDINLRDKHISLMKYKVRVEVCVVFFFLFLCTECPITNKYFISTGNVSMGTIIIKCCKVSVAKSFLSLLHCSSKVKCQGKKRTGKLMQPSIHQQVEKEWREERKQQRTVQFVKAPSLHFKI